MQVKDIFKITRTNCQQEIDKGDRGQVERHKKDKLRKIERKRGKVEIAKQKQFVLKTGKNEKIFFALYNFVLEKLL